jgi:hypothetical protein
VNCAASGNNYIFTGVAGTQSFSQGNLGEGLVPVGFVWLRSVRTTATAPTAAATPILYMGWGTGNAFGTYDGTATVMLPVFTPPEFGNSTLPYSRTRANATSALFTNVTAALNKEGTVLAARLKPSIIDMWSFGVANINSVHPQFRYFGPMEKGLYTFTSPSQN